MSNNAAWSDAENDKMKRMWAEGFSASEISRALGGHRSRNAVIGRLHRMGLSGTKENRRGPRPPRNGARRGGQARAAQVRANTVAKFAPVSGRKRGPRPPEAGLTPELRAIAALDPLDPSLKIIHAGALCCRYIRDPLGPVCGRVASEGAWCAEHRKLVYRPEESQSRTRARVDRIVEMAR